MPAQNLSLKTRTSYQADLTDLIEFLAQQGIVKPRQVTRQLFERYQVGLEKRGYKVSTRERKIYAIKSYFRFLHRYGIIAINFAAKLIPPQVIKSDPRYLAEQEYHALLDVARDTHATHPSFSCFTNRDIAIGAC